MEGLDELIIDREKTNLLDKNKDRIEENYHVKVGYDVAMQADESGKDWKQWVTIMGTPGDRKGAKDYIKALCNPLESVPLKYPTELHTVLTNSRIHARLETQSKTAILFLKEGEAVIQGIDALSVTLAMSSVEDLIAKYENQENDISPIKSSPSAQMASARLDSAIMRLSSQDDGIELDEDMARMPAAVKRSILGWLRENNQSPENESNITTPPKKPKSSDLFQVTSQLQKGIHISPQPNKSASGAGKAISTDVSKLDENGKDDMKEFALKKGYSNEEIEEVLKIHGSNIKPSDFLRALFTNRRMKKIRPDPTATGVGIESGVGLLRPEMLQPAPNSGPENSGNTDMQHPLEHILSEHGSPHLKVKQREGSPDVKQKLTKTEHKKVAEYMEKLAKHFTEEDEIESIDDLKKKNLERQKILREHFDRKKKKVPTATLR